MKMTSNRQRFVFAIAVLGGLFVPNAFAVVNLNDNFDSAGDVVGSPPPGWTVGGNGFVVITNNLYQSAPRSLFLAVTNYDGSQITVAEKLLSPSVPKGTNAWVDVRFDINPSQTDAPIQIWLMNSGSTPFSVLNFNAGGQITAWNNSLSGYQTVASYSAQTWYGVDIGFNPSLQYYHLAVETNQTLYATASNLTFAANVNFDYFLALSYGKPSAPASFYLDNVFVEVPEPGSAALVVLTLGGLLLRRRLLSC